MELNEKTVAQFGTAVQDKIAVLQMKRDALAQDKTDCEQTLRAIEANLATVTAAIARWQKGKATADEALTALAAEARP